MSTLLNGTGKVLNILLMLKKESDKSEKQNCNNNDQKKPQDKVKTPVEEEAEFKKVEVDTTTKRFWP